MFHCLNYTGQSNYLNYVFLLTLWTLQKHYLHWKAITIIIFIKWYLIATVLNITQFFTETEMQKPTPTQQDLQATLWRRPTNVTISMLSLFHLSCQKDNIIAAGLIIDATGACLHFTFQYIREPAAAAAAAYLLSICNSFHTLYVSLFPFIIIVYVSFCLDDCVTYDGLFRQSSRLVNRALYC